MFVAQSVNEAEADAYLISSTCCHHMLLCACKLLADLVCLYLLTQSSSNTATHPTTHTHTHTHTHALLLLYINIYINRTVKKYDLLSIYC